MQTRVEYLERAKAATNTDSDSNLARKIGIKRQYLHRFKKGEIMLSEDVMLRLAERANLDPQEALILLNFWRAQGEAKALYARMLQKFTAIAALVFVIYSPALSPSANALNLNAIGNSGHVAATCANIAHSNDYAIFIMQMWLM